jgi:branched-chain amino acid transport system substrate-binding protein
MESIQGFDLGGFLPPMNLSPQDHEGGGWVRIWQVQEGGRWAPATDWFHGYREVVLEHVAKAQ